MDCTDLVRVTSPRPTGTDALRTVVPALPAVLDRTAGRAWFLFRRRDDRGRTHSAEEILGERYARDEITAEEYRQRREVLRTGG